LANFLKTKDIDVVLLCGGMGKRLRSIVRAPKSMAEINGRPFLDILIEYIAGFGFRRFILCTGYKGDEIRAYYEKRHKGPLEILFSEEKEPLDTAGALKNAEPFIKSPTFLAANGDSLCETDLNKFLVFHFEKNALSSLILTKVKDGSDYGTVSLEKSRRIDGFDEKSKWTEDSFISAGVYLFEKKALSLIPPGVSFSLERDFFPKILNRAFYGYVTGGAFIDIGTPERYEKAKTLL